MRCPAYKTCKIRDEESRTCVKEAGEYYEGGGEPGCLRRWRETGDST